MEPAPYSPPAFSSSHRELHEAYALAVRELGEDISPQDGLMRAGANWSTVWTRDIAYAAALGAALAAPAACRRSLESRVRDGIILQDTGTGGGWPVSTDRVSWALGAWAVYTATGDKEWLAYCVEVLQNTLAQDAEVLPDTVLRSGETSFLDWREQSYPDWMTPADIGATYALGTNVVHYMARLTLARMLRKLGREEEAHAVAEEAHTLGAEINRRFWNPSTNRYGMFCTADGWLDERSDALGTALAVFSGLAGEHGLRALAALPRSPYGTPVFAPYKASLPAAYHNRAVWPFVEAFVMMAHAELQDTAGAARSMAALLRGAAENGTNKENWHAETGRAADTLLNSDRQLWSVAGMLGLFYYGLFGIQTEKGNLVFSPCVPKAYAGSHWLMGVRLRGMVLNIHLNGYGTEIAAVMVNGKPGSPLIPLDTEGHVQVELELMPAEDEESDASPEAAEDLPTPEWLERPAPDVLAWAPVEGAESYCVYRNGRAFANRLDCRCPVSGGHTYFNEYQVQALNNKTASCLSRPAECVAEGARRLLQPARIGAETEYAVEHGRAWLDTRDCTARLNYEETELPAGTYRVRVRYSNATQSKRDGDTCALRELVVDGEPRGMVVLPHNTEAGQWENYDFTAPLTLQLPAGRHTFSLHYTPRCTNTNIECNQCMVAEMEVTRIEG